jgi:hypothetical protein
VARVHNSFEMGVAPEQAQAMFVRDLIPDLHRDGRFTTYREAPGQLRLSDADFGREPGFGRGLSGGANLDLDDIADPDEFEVHDEEGSEPALADALRRGTDAEAPAATGHGRHSAEMLLSHRLKVTFAPRGDGTLVTVKGSAHDDVRKGLDRLGTPQHWPETADAPHD